MYSARQFSKIRGESCVVLNTKVLIPSLMEHQTKQRWTKYRGKVWQHCFTLSWGDGQNRSLIMCVPFLIFYT